MLTPADAQSYRALRLEGLQLNPESFGAHITEEEALPISEFARRIEPNERSFVLGAFDESDALSGIVGWFRERGLKSAHGSFLWGTYVRAGCRSNGLGSALISAVIARAQMIKGVRHISLHVGSRNEAGKALYSKNGFRYLAFLPEALQLNGEFIDEELWRLLLINEG